MAVLFDTAGYGGLGVLNRVLSWLMFVVLAEKYITNEPRGAALDATRGAFVIDSGTFAVARRERFLV